jgi:23S rRNA G2069 N7-methylase RlmK/C1962 C5-methylase RlmI
MSKKTLDACCGSRMFWFNRQHPDAVFMDNREVDTNLCDERKLLIAPDIVADFTAIPFADETFYLVVFDPPHLVNAGENSWLAKKYGKLQPGWEDILKKGFAECFRVLKNNGTLIFKWNEDQVSLKKVLALTDEKPLFGNRRSKTHWIVFMKITESEVEKND